MWKAKHLGRDAKTDVNGRHFVTQQHAVHSYLNNRISNDWTAKPGKTPSMIAEYSMALCDNVKNGPNPASFCLFSFFSNTNFTEKTVVVSGIQTRIVGLEGEPVDHLTTTTALCV